MPDPSAASRSTPVSPVATPRTHPYGGHWCTFCNIVAGVGPATVVRRWRDAIAIVPLNPVTEGHVLIISKYHVVDAVQEPQVTADVMRAAAEYAERPCNIITSSGDLATQTVSHLHVHVVPRREGDGLALPWTGGAE